MEGIDSINPMDSNKGKPPMDVKYKFPLISPIRWFVDHEWNLYRQFLNSLEPRVDEVLKDWVEATELEAAQIEDADNRAEFWDFHIDDYNDRLEFKTILLSSFFLSAFALLEYHNIKICDQIRKDKDCPFSVYDLRSGGPSIEEAKTYLERLGVESPSRNSRKWQAIMDYKWVRNRLVHDAGYLRNEKESAHAKSLGILSDRYFKPSLVLTKEFCDKALVDFQGFLLDIERSYYQETS